MDAIILAGGKGTRLKNIVPNVPKSLAPINGIPFLDFLISFLQTQKEIEKIILSVGYEKEQIIKRYKNLENIIFCEEDSPLGTGGAIKNALSLITSENFLAMNGDTYIEYSLSDFLNFHIEKKADITVLSNYQKNFSRYGSLNLDKDTKKIISFDEKKETKNGYISSGVYIMKKNIFDPFSFLDSSFSLENDFFPIATKEKNILAYEISSFFIDIGIESSYLEAQKYFTF
jgi:D-glycero-alpha-D-manno-heptose 1-phosphate guanylyltransferase